MKNFGLRNAKKLLPKRKVKSHKGDHGRVVLFAGSSDYPGAGVLAANAAARMGAGYVVLISPRFIKDFMNIPEVIFKESSKWNWKASQPNWVYVIGPGFGLKKQNKQTLEKLIAKAHPKVVLDADALTALGKLQKKLPSTWVLTPHEGELARLLKTALDQVKADRLRSVKLASKKYSCIVLLKGHPTLICDGKNVWKITIGNAGLAKAGSGDVLSGFIGALMAQGLESLKAALLGAYIHGLLSSEWVKSGRDMITLLPSDLTQNVPKLVAKIRQGKISSS